MHPPQDKNFWKLCHWVALAGLCLFAGGAALVSADVTKFTLNRILVVVFYLWVGCYMMDIAFYTRWQEGLARTTGFLSWAVAAGDLAISCACGAGGVPEPPQGFGQKEPARASAQQALGGVGGASYTADADAAESGEAGPSAPPPQEEKGAPKGGWNTSFALPLGSRR